MENFYKSLLIGGLGILRAKQLEQLQAIELDARKMMLELAIRERANSKNIKGQLCQDLFVLYALNWKRGGFFVEFGATNGLDLSNTYLLEKDFGWNGILAEPANIWHTQLKKNRSATLDFDCVWKESGQSLEFSVAEIAEFSTIASYVQSDAHKKSRKNSCSQSVTTVSLNDLLERHDAPSVIDYLSIDTEGSEFEILNALDFNRFTISVITCEHNFSSNRKKIYELLVHNGYKRVFQGLSRWDDWYIHSSLQRRCI